MDTAKLYRAGNSTVIALPRKYLKALNWFPGQVIEVTLSNHGGLNLMPVWQRNANIMRSENELSKQKNQ
ncbi:MAG: hypothetical protein OEM02_12335 [Desulfobulbaceae bacterium]|nr:hypothetical protein [Desulfobulbaceae bacterium]